MARTKMSKAAGKMIDRQRMGTEPMHQNVLTPGNLADYYNWLSHFYSAADGRKFLMEFLTRAKANPAKIDLMQRMPDAFFVPRSSILWNCRILNRGMRIDSEFMERFKTRLAQMFVDAATYTADSINEPQEAPERVAVAVRVERKAFNLTANIDEIIDAYLNGQDEDWDELLKAIPLNSSVAKYMTEVYQKQLDEVDLALSGKDPNVSEGYKGYTKPALKAFAAFLERIVNHLKMTAASEKPRKARSRKIKTATQLTKKVNYQQNDSHYKLTSVDPASIIGASELWAFNTKTRMLTVLRAAEPSGLTIKGTTVLGYEDGHSGMKKLRKPETTLPNIVGGGKVAVRKTFEELTTTASIPKGRINGDMILVRTFR